MNAVKSETPAQYTVDPLNVQNRTSEQEQQILDAALRIMEARFSRGVAITSPSVCRDYFIHHFASRTDEAFSVMFRDTQHRVLATETLFLGTIDSCAVYPRVIVKRALELNAGAIILSHNHPSGKPEPSQADRMLTRKIQDTMQVIDVRVLDHIVAAGTDTFSFAENGLI